MFCILIFFVFVNCNNAYLIFDQFRRIGCESCMVVVLRSVKMHNLRF